MSALLFSIITQALLFLPLALGISISYHILRATDMTIDGSFVLGAAVFARLLTLGFPPTTAMLIAVCGGALAGCLTAFIQRGGRVDPLLAGILATFILSSLNLSIMGKPNISLLTQTTLLSDAFNKSEMTGWIIVALFTFSVSLLTLILLKSKLGLRLRAFGDNPTLFSRLGNNVELYRFIGFGLTNMLAAFAGCMTAQTVGYADVGMGLGMTLTGIGTIVLGHQLLKGIIRNARFRAGSELLACVLGVSLYFLSLNVLLRMEVDPIYLKLILGVSLIFFLRAAVKTIPGGMAP